MPRRWICEEYDQMSSSESERSIGLTEADWSNSRIAQHLGWFDVSIRQFWQKCVNNGRTQLQEGNSRFKGTTESSSNRRTWLLIHLYQRSNV
ncbi:hypothetical protein TNCV_4733481 [Trichonephila clavipes]|nr:hypothetical protein TNCV_4733481 [Trichonephila clavipes]